MRATEKEAFTVLSEYLTRALAGTKVQLVRPDGSTHKLARRGKRIITVLG